MAWNPGLTHTLTYKQQIRMSVLLVVLLLTMHSFIVWHQHDDHAASDSHCELCLFSQHHTPAPGSASKALTVFFSQYTIQTSFSAVPQQPAWHYFSLARAPPFTLS